MTGRPSSTERSGHDELHGLLLELARLVGLLHPDRSISLSQVFVLHELDTKTAMSQRDLADRLYLEKSTISRLVAQMEQDGLLVREPDPANRRYYRLRLTTAGRAAHARLRTEFHGRYSRLVATLSSGERDALLIGLPALVQALRSDLG